MVLIGNRRMDGNLGLHCRFLRPVPQVGEGAARDTREPGMRKGEAQDRRTLDRQ